jgi:tetratricopeptide (TPR) repeat protein
MGGVEVVREGVARSLYGHQASLGRYEEAIASYDKALEFESDNPWIEINRAELKFALELSGETLKSFENAIKPLTQNLVFGDGYVESASKSPPFFEHPSEVICA